MMYKFMFLVLVVPTLTASAFVSSTLTTKIEDALQKNPGFYFLGTVEGKAFFMDNSTTREWEDAKEFCENINMKLGSTTSQVQHDFLISKHELLRHGQTRHYWLNGIVRHSTDAYEWRDSGDHIENYGRGAFSSAQILNIAFAASSPTQASLGAYPHTYTFNLLCENL